MKKLISITLATAIAASTAITAFAAATPKITGMTENLSMGYSSAQGQSTVDLGTVYPQDEHTEYIDLYDTMFTWDSGYVAAATPTQLTVNQVRDAKLDAKVTNSRVIREVSVNVREGRVEVSFPKELVGAKEIDFDFDVVLSIDGRRQSDHGMTFTGTFSNPVIDVYSGYDTVDISDGSVAEAMESVKNIALELGDGVTATANLHKGQRVYATAIRTPDRSDEDMMKQHPEIKEVVTLKTEGLRNGTVKLDGRHGKSHVYDGDLNYLGMSTDSLPLASKYYLAKEKLDLDEAEVEESSKPTSVPKTNASVNEPAATNNANANPMTGR